MRTEMSDDPDLECPICHDVYSEPKILPCAHLACKICLLTWLGKSQGDGGCPICRSPIRSPSSLPAQDDLAAALDSLPTNLAITALVESQEVLRSSHICGVCLNSVTATSFCMQCDVKLCQACADYHGKLPATKQHTLEHLSKLTAQRLANNYRVTCGDHPDKLAELFCHIHRRMICVRCASLSHGNCLGKKTVTEVVADKRRELGNRAKALRLTETSLNRKIQDNKRSFKIAREKIKDTFEDLQRLLEKRRREAEREVQAQEESTTTSLTTLQTLKTALASNASTVEKLVTTAPEAALLGMVADLTVRLDQLQAHAVKDTATLPLQVPDFIVDGEKLTLLKAEISALGQVSKTSQATKAPPCGKEEASEGKVSKAAATSKPKSFPPSTLRHRSKSLARLYTPKKAALAKVLKVGDRVKASSDFRPAVIGSRSGTVIAIPSKRGPEGRNTQGLVDVLWDDGQEGYCVMGYNNEYYLELLAD